MYAFSERGEVVSYRVRIVIHFHRREVHCVDADNENFFERFPSVYPSSSPNLETINQSTSSTFNYSKGGLIFVICTIVVVIAVLIIVMIHKKKNVSDLTEPFINNRIIVTKSGEDGVPNYGTFSS